MNSYIFWCYLLDMLRAIIKIENYKLSKIAPLFLISIWNVFKLKKISIGILEGEIRNVQYLSKLSTQIIYGI